MATLANLAARLRLELGDNGKSFVWQTVADGLTNRYQIPHSPVNGPDLIVQVNGEDVPDSCVIEENTGFLTFDDIPPAGANIIVAGTVFRYFTETEISAYISSAFLLHAHNATTINGRPVTLDSLPAVDEYPLVILATANALQTLATDAAFDIDIIAPDGVNIPRSERYRQLMEMVALKKAQYEDLCSQLGTGLYRIEVFQPRRISMRTNRYVPIYIPQEVDDHSYPKRVRLPIPTYGAVQPSSTASPMDLTMYQGDDFSLGLNFPLDLTGFDIDAQIKYGPGAPLLMCLTVDVPDIPNGLVTISLTGEETRRLPERANWDLQLTTPDGARTTWFAGEVFCEREVTVVTAADPSATGWRG